MIEVKVKRLHPNAVIPSYAKDGDAGMDLTAVEIEYTKEYVSYKVGLAFEIPDGYVGLLFPRSSNSKKDLILSNSVGILDSGYRGGVEFRYKSINNQGGIYSNTYDIGDRVGQLIVIPYPKVAISVVDELSNSERGEGGFGSSGK